MRSVHVCLICAAVLLGSSVARAKDPGRTAQIRAALAQKLGVQPNRVRFRSYRMGIYDLPAARGERRFVTWRVKGQQSLVGSAEIGLIKGGSRGAFVHNVRRGGFDGKKALTDVARRFGDARDLYHALRGSGVSPQQPRWNGSTPGPIRAKRPRNARNVVTFALRRRGRLIGYAEDLRIQKPGTGPEGLRRFFGVDGRQVKQVRFTPED